MRILFIANRIPYPPYRGDKLKIFNLAQQLHQRHELKLVTFYEKADELPYKMDLLRLFETVDLVYLNKFRAYWNVVQGLLFNKLPLQISFFKSRSMVETVADVIYGFRPDAIHVQHLRMAQFIPSNYRNKAILDLPDAISMYYERIAEFSHNPFYKWVYKLEENRLKEYESLILSKFQKVLCCSQEDLNYLKKEHPFPKYGVLENGVDVKNFTPDNDTVDLNQDLEPSANVAEKIILFTGNMNYAPNVDAVIYFAQKILPRILEKWPQAIFEIAGQNPVNVVQKLDEHPNIRVTGFLPSLREAYAKADVVVAPLRFGAGTQNKVLEALSMQKPVVCSTIGFFGLSLENGAGIWCETNIEGFSKRILEIFSDPEYHGNLARISGKIVRDRFNWQTISKKLESYCLDLQNEN